MKTVKEFLNKLESENRNIEIDYNDMDTNIVKDSAIIARFKLYDYDNDCEETNKNIELPFEYLTTTIMKFNGVSCSKESVLHFASYKEIMKELMDMEIV